MIVGGDIVNETVRARVLGELEVNLSDFEKYSNDEFEADNVIVNVQTVRQLIGLLREKPGVWQYYVNDDGKARWKCSKCGKICRRNPYDKRYCSQCGQKMSLEA